MLGRQALDLDPDVMIADQRENLFEQGQGFAVRQPDLRRFLAGQQRDGPEPRHVGVVMHHQLAVASGMHVELYAVGVEHQGAPEGGSGVLVLVS